MNDSKYLLQPIKDIALEAGRVILDIYREEDFGTKYKTDSSPVTEADLRSNNIIVKSLAELTPTIPVVSEELLNSSSTGNEVWMVDPLDGTTDFLKRNDEFTVNIALIRDGQPILGIIYAPALHLFYYASVGSGAYKQDGDNESTRLSPSPELRPRPVVLISRSHHDQATVDWLSRQVPHDLLPLGSSLKFCYLAEKKADIYAKLAPIREWDTAAGEIILRESGGQIMDFDSHESPGYNKPDFVQHPFIAISDSKLKELIKY